MSERVLLIDDDQVFVQVLARALTARGFAVGTAGNRIDALAAARELRPDHAVLDLRLGEENGLALIPELLELLPDLRILLLTGYASIARRIRAGVRGAAAEAARMGAHPARARRMRGQYFRSGATARPASTDSAAQARQAARARVWRYVTGAR